MRPRLLLFPGSALFAGPVAEAKLHAHLALQLVIGSQGPFELTVEGTTGNHLAAVIDSRVPHRLVAPRGVWMLLVDPTAIQGSASETLRPAVRSLPPDAIQEVLALAERVDAKDARIRVLAARMRALAVDGAPPAHGATDLRVRAVLALLDTPDLPDPPWTLERLAGEVGLSPSRLRHLFRDEIGLPLRSYRLWNRMGRAVSLLAEGQNLTRAAHDAGFVDSAHLSRAFRKMFGITPSSLTTSGVITQM